MFNFNTDKNIWLLPSSSLDKNLHPLFCASSTVFHDALMHLKHITAWNLLVVFGYRLGMFQHRAISQGFGCPGGRNSLKPKLGPKTCPNEGSSAAGASPTAHGVSDSLFILCGCQGSMQRCLECTWQTSSVSKHTGNYLLRSLG